MKTIDTNYVNPFGKVITASAINEGLKAAAKSKPGTGTAPPQEFHKGWKVTGIPPGALEEAEKAHDKLQDTRLLREREPFRRDHWIANQRGKPVRPQPYFVPEAAEQCAELARKAGWLSVQVTEVAKRKQAIT